MMRKKQWFEEAIALMKERGLSRRSLQELVREPEDGKGLEDWDQFLMELTDYLISTCERMIIQQDEEGSFFERLERFIRRVMISDIGLTNCLFHNDLDVKEETKGHIREKVRQFNDQMNQFFEALLNQGRMEGKLRRPFNDLERSMLTTMIVANGALYSKMRHTDEDTFVITLLDLVMKVLR